jgi:peroxiredoxin
MNRKIVLLLASVLLIGKTTMAQLPKVAEDVTPLLVGEVFPMLTLQNESGKDVNLAQFTKSKPTVIIFYRGGWCPYCNAHLTQVAAIEDKIKNAGYQVIAISPDAPAQLTTTKDKDKLKYPLLFDAGGKLARAAGIAFAAPENYVEVLGKYSDGKNDGYLPVPALFVVGTDGVIVFEYVSPNFKKRISNDLLLSVVKSLK